MKSRDGSKETSLATECEAQKKETGVERERKGEGGARLGTEGVGGRALIVSSGAPSEARRWREA